MRAIGVVTVARSDYGIYRPILRRAQADPDLAVYLFVAGMHLSPDYGLTVRDIERDGFDIRERVEMLLASTSPEAVAKAMGLGTIGFAQAFARSRPDLLLVLGDRFEMHAAALAALPFTIPVAHIHGGEITEGAIDDALRHSMTKMSHLHFVAAEAYARRLRQMGEEPWRITVSGAPGLDNLRDTPLQSRAELAREFGLDLPGPFLLVTYHPVTLEYQDTAAQVTELLAALDAVDLPVVFTAPNADTHGRVIAGMLHDYAAARPRAYLVDSLGTQGYFSLMSHAAAMAGNSSSGIIEAASFALPVVNVGTRQRGRLRAANVIATGYGRDEIRAALERALSPAFRAGLAGLANPYGDGHASERIVARLKEVALDRALLHKQFCEP
jgi:UDP-N-acetylglucosamine 2-epimerase (non-hydrolysing)/GDP/UDP-N,N'-diacetylbacillosamine 2-epimerase (hydrolysing)